MAGCHPFHSGVFCQQRLIKDYLLVFLAQFAILPFILLAYRPEVSGNLSTKTVDMRVLLCFFQGYAGQRRSLEEEVLYHLRNQTPLLGLL